VKYGTASFFFIIAAATYSALPVFLSCALPVLVAQLISSISDVRQFLYHAKHFKLRWLALLERFGSAEIFLKSHERGSNDVGATNVNIVIRRLQRQFMSARRKHRLP